MLWLFPIIQKIYLQKGQKFIMYKYSHPFLSNYFKIKIFPCLHYSLSPYLLYFWTKQWIRNGEGVVSKGLKGTAQWKNAKRKKEREKTRPKENWEGKETRKKKWLWRWKYCVTFLFYREINIFLSENEESRMGRIIWDS